VQDVYQLVCVARDDHSPQQLTATVTITVLVDDVNDNAPEFILPRRPGSVSAANSTGAGAAAARSEVTVLMSDRAVPGSLITAV